MQDGDGVMQHDGHTAEAGAKHPFKRQLHTTHVGAYIDYSLHKLTLAFFETANFHP